MPLAHVHLTGASSVPGSLPRLHDPVFKTEEVGVNGTFKISTREIGSLVLQCTGVGHEDVSIPLPLEHPTDVEIGIRLARAFVDTARSEIEILTSVDKGATTQRASLAKQADGNF